LVQAAIRTAWHAAHALVEMPSHVIDRLPEDALCALARAAAHAESLAAWALVEMPSHVIDRLPEDALCALAHATAQDAQAAAQALGGMPPITVERLTEASLIALAQATSREMDVAAHALVEMPSHVIDRLPEDALCALAHATAQEAEWATEALHSPTATLRQDDPAAQARAARLSVMLIASAADVLSADALIAWAQEAPISALAHTDVLAALLARVQTDEAAVTLTAILDARLAPPDAPPSPSPHIVRSWRRRR
jgi:hypothetical protein